jgi:CSLREA domain-containing protein
MGKRRGTAVAAAAIGLVAAATAWSPPAAVAGGTDFTVTTTADVVDGGDGLLSLREAITAANTDGNNTGVVLNLGANQFYSLTICDGGTDEDGNVGGDLDLTAPESVSMVGLSSFTIDQTCPGERVLEKTSATGGLSLSRGFITGGSTAGDGGGLLVAGTLNLSLGATLFGNSAGGFGGGADVGGTAAIIQSTVRGNTAGNDGGGVNAMDVSATASTFDGNATEEHGGGIAAEDDADINRSTITQNVADDSGGGVFASDLADLDTSTVLANRSFLGASVAADNLTAVSSVIALGSLGDDCEVDQVPVSNGFNGGFDGSCELAGTGDVGGVHPMLAPLADLGGITEVRRTVGPSPVLDLDTAPCLGQANDQINTPRPQGPGCDSGASEGVAEVCTENFPDVPDTSQFFDEICWLDQMGITSGFGDGSFKPAQAVTRQSMAAFIYRLAGAPPFPDPVTASFGDVATSSQFFTEIEWMAEEGITGGFPGGVFKPGQAVSRQAMAAFLYRVAGEPAFPDPPVATFSDVPTTSQFFTEIEWMNSEGITTGFPGGLFKPSQAVSRQGMAAFLLRLSADVVLAGL